MGEMWIFIVVTARKITYFYFNSDIKILWRWSVFLVSDTRTLNVAARLSKKGVHKYFENCGNHHKQPGARSMTWIKFCAEEPQILGATVQNSVVR